MYKKLYSYTALTFFLRQFLLLLVFPLGLVRGGVGTLSDPRAHALTCPASTPPRWEALVQFSASPGRRPLGLRSIINYNYICFLGTQKDGTSLLSLMLGVLRHLLCK